MQEQTNLDKLNEKVSQILQKYDAMKNENELLRAELVQSKAQMELKDQEIDKLNEASMLKDLEIEEIATKIESILG